MKKPRGHLRQDIGIVFLSILVALILVRTDTIPTLLSYSRELDHVGSFIAGLFFTSVFTTAPAIAAFGEIAQVYSLFWTAFFGALGAVLGDFILFRFLRDRFSDDLMEVLRHNTGGKRVRALLKLKFFRWFTFLLGGIIIASPLPDELGISLLGFSKTKTSWFIPLSFTFNFLGILLIGAVSRSLF